MIESILQICALLADSTLSVQEVASRLGTLVEDQGGNLPLIVRPRDAAFAEAIVTRQYGTQRPASILLTLSRQAELNVGDLRASFGPYTRLARQPGQKRPHIKFFIGEPTEEGSTSLIASLTPLDWGDLDRGTVSELTLQPEF